MPNGHPSLRPWLDRHRTAAAGVLALALALAPACARRPEMPFIPDAAVGLPRFELKGNILTFNGQTLRFRDSLESWLRVLGPPSESKTGWNWNDPIRHWYFGKSVQIEAYGTVDGRAYVCCLGVDLGDNPGAEMHRCGLSAPSASPMRPEQRRSPALGSGSTWIWQVWKSGQPRILSSSWQEDSPWDLRGRGSAPLISASPCGSPVTHALLPSPSPSPSSPDSSRPRCAWDSAAGFSLWRTT